MTNKNYQTTIFEPKNNPSDKIVFEPDQTAFDAVIASDDNNKPPFNVAASQESTRANIAKAFSFFFMTMVFLALVGPFIVNAVAPETFANPIEDAKNLATTVASILGGPFGFIVGYYFKQNDS